MKHDKKSPLKRLKKHDITQLVARYFQYHPTEIVDIHKLFRSLRLNTHPSKMLCMDVLDELVEQGAIIEQAPMQYVSRLNKHLSHEEEIHDIMSIFHLPTAYPEEAKAAAEALNPSLTTATIKGREDMRDRLTFTIDPRDAKDFDDALSFKSLGANTYEVGVHIADVSHYVTEGSPIDKEAQRRATSVYLVDCVIPMLPERLCNDICSLRPNEDKLTYSVIFHLNDNAEIQQWHLAHTVVRSDRRFTYEEVQTLLETQPSFDKAQEPFVASLATLNSLAQKLRSKRFAHGAVDFERAEVHFDLDTEGKPVEISLKYSQDANKLIEEFMLLANRTVAEYIGKASGNKKTLPYRVHDIPDQEKLVELAHFTARFGNKILTRGSKKDISESLNNLLRETRGTPRQNLIEILTLRAMQKAKYSTVNIGHYGLAFAYYTHFTSPIRRYPDLMVHRLLTRYAEGAKSANKDLYEDLCKHCSEQEQNAVQAERTSIRYKQVEFMAAHIGETFQATIVNVMDYGFYVELDENKCEGLVKTRSLLDDYYYFDERKLCLIGRRQCRKYSIGDVLTVRVQRVNILRKQIDFVVVEA